MVAWVVLCAWVTWTVRDRLRAAADQVQRAVEVTTRLGGSVQQAGDAAGRVPIVGSELGRPLNEASGNVAELAASAQQQVDLLRQVADISIIALFVLPVALVIWWWLPRRIRFVADRRTAQQFIDADADLSLFALRAMAHQPMARIAAISDDPVTDWRTGNAPVVRQLAALELKTSGLSLPASTRGTGASAATPADPPTPPSGPVDDVG